MKYILILAFLLSGCAVFEEPVKCYQNKVWVRPYVSSDVYEPTNRTCKTKEEFK